MFGSRERGYTLVELMIGLLVGLIVLSAVLYIFLASLRSSKDVLNSYRLNQEVGLISDIVTGEIRRVGYWPISGAGTSVYGAEKDLEFVSSASSSCLLFSYYDDSNSALGQVIRGFRFSESSGLGTLSYVASTSWGSCSTASWVLLTDSDFIDIDTMDFQFDCWDISAEPPVSVASGTWNASCGHEVGKIISRSIGISLEASVVKDPVWKSRFSETIKLQNDINGE